MIVLQVVGARRVPRRRPAVGVVERDLRRLRRLRRLRLRGRRLRHRAAGVLQVHNKCKQTNYIVMQITFI